MHERICGALPGSTDQANPEVLAGATECVGGLMASPDDTVLVTKQELVNLYRVAKSQTVQIEKLLLRETLTAADKRASGSSDRT